ncbi:hypothetical protein [Zobellia nedashkovskayae]|uniref:hypothetical protein n=1 Tax=Zobellia nedashkovskayae TaxID=2779510 RepID=UPI00188D0129|nr:hypothetical protein [Zobellia nedashkovskayae]
MHLTHIKLKPTTKIDLNFDTSEIGKGIESPKSAIEESKEYLKSNKHSDFYSKDLMVVVDQKLIYVFDYFIGKEKILIPEINPSTVFYSNAVMSHRRLVSFKKDLFENSPTVKNFNKRINLNLFGNFFQLASNCIVNLQAALESFANRQIPDNHPFLDVNGKEFEPSIFHKLDKALPEIKGKKFKSKFRKYNFLVRRVIELRNEIIHLTPIEETTNTKYKTTYRKLLSFDYAEAIISVEQLINFYEPGLIEKCDCGKEFYYDIEERYDSK